MNGFKFSLLFAMFFIVDVVSGQEVVSSSGNFNRTNNIQMSWTIGEPVIETCLRGNYCLTQGMHQSDLVVTAFDDDLIAFQVIAYPNPVKTFVNLEIKKQDLSGMNYILFDSKGRMVAKEKIQEHRAKISFTGFTPAEYLLKVFKNQKPIKTFKIIKIG